MSWPLTNEQNNCKQCKQIARNDWAKNDWMMNSNGHIQYQWHKYGKQSFNMFICVLVTEKWNTKLWFAATKMVTVTV